MLTSERYYFMNDVPSIHDKHGEELVRRACDTLSRHAELVAEIKMAQRIERELDARWRGEASEAKAYYDSLLYKVPAAAPAE